MSNVPQPNRNASCYLKNVRRLEQLCTDGKLKLLKDYKEINVTMETIIEAECMAEGCNEKTNKNFRTIDLRGCYCKIHIKKNKRDKLKTTRNTKTSYDIELLQQLCKDNNIILLKDYTNLNVIRETIIEAKCLTEGCIENVNTTFGNVVYRGCYCDICANKNKHTKTKATCNQIYGEGIENPSQDVRQILSEGKQGNKNPMFGKHANELYNSKLDEIDILWIRKNFIPHSSTNGIRAFSKKYNVDRQTIKKIVDGKSYKNVDGQIQNNNRITNNKFSKEDILWIRRNYIAHHPEFGGVPMAKKFNTNETRIWKIITYKVWKNI